MTLGVRPAVYKSLYLGLSLILAGCGGIKPESRVAQTLQTLMTLVIEGNLQVVNGQAAAGSIACGADGAGGTLAFGAGFSTIDPSNPGAATVSFPVTFSNCVIKACDKTVTVDGAGLTVTMSASDVASGLSKSFDVSMTAADLSTSGVVEGRLSFGYILRATITRSNIGGLSFVETAPANPLQYQSRTYHAEHLIAYADGC